MKNNKGWELVKLGVVANNLDGKRKPLNESERNKISKKNLFPYIGANNIMDYIDEYLFDEEILCIAEDGGSWGKNQTCANYYNEKCWVNNHAHVLGYNGKADLKFLMYYLNFEDLSKYITGSTRGKLTKSALDNLLIPLPPLPEQQRIAALLDAADALRRKDKALLQKYEELAQSVFMDMFGDPVRNERGWVIETLKNCTTKIGSGATPTGGKTAYKKEGITLVRSMNVYDNSFKYKDLAFIDEKQAEKLKNVEVEKNDVLFNITGASVCRCTIVPDKILPARVNQHVSIIRPKSYKLNYLFLNYLLVSERIKNKLLNVGSAGGAVMEAITKEQLENFEIIIPPISEQTEFANRIKLIEDQKTKLSANLSNSEALFASLLQEAFGG
jgi:type I restriction enzyme S subunit